DALRAQDLSRRSIWLGRVEEDAATIPDDTGHQTREIGYRNFETRPDIHRLATHMTPEQKHHRIRQIVDVEEFPERLPRAPKFHGFRPSLFGFVHPAHESGDDV